MYDHVNIYDLNTYEWTLINLVYNNDLAIQTNMHIHGTVPYIVELQNRVLYAKS